MRRTKMKQSQKSDLIFCDEMRKPRSFQLVIDTMSKPITVLIELYYNQIVYWLQENEDNKIMNSSSIWVYIENSVLDNCY